MATLKINDTLVTEPSEVAEKLGRHFSDIITLLTSRKSEMPKFHRILSLDKFEAYNAKFSLREFREALISSEASTPGEDLKHLPDDAKTFLPRIMNKIWETGILPKDWKISILVPVKKPSKDALQATSYRPVALTSCVCKLMEKIINTRLVWHLESKGLIAPCQFGFRKNQSTLDPLLRLTNQIQQGFAKRCQTISVFFDLEQAWATCGPRHVVVWPSEIF